MQIVQDKISIEELKKMSQKMFGGLVKAVVDIDREIIIVDAEMHADQEELLLEQGSAARASLGHKSSSSCGWERLDRI